jgi:hypothetical protein
MTPDSELGYLLRLIAINAYAAWYNGLGSGGSGRAYDQYKRSGDPRPGDVVIETSTVRRWASHADEAPQDQYAGIGVLLRKVMEPIMTDEKLAALHAEGDFWVKEGETIDDIPKELVWYIRPLDGTVREYRWTNADFIRVLSSMNDL